MKSLFIYLLLILSLFSGRLYAQSESSDAFDPFSDYSEFDQDSDEEADINFFRNGRLLTLGLAAGPRQFTENMSKSYGSGPNFGIQISYFFDLKTALGVGIMTGDSALNFSTISGNTINNYSGNVSFTSINFNIKYFMNTQNVTKGLADINPYILGGFSQWYRTVSISEFGTQSRENVMGADLGIGVEIPLMRRKAFLGFQATYHYINFADEGKEFLYNGTTNELLEHKINGDLMDILLILGLNF
ncbi:MAG: outer membrane beta-barrel protein [Bdellovibrionaceae bacterium]|nr:outer membrane beta-barrel protein [Pseudobdellovibrionaceae bacterium]